MITKFNFRKSDIGREVEFSAPVLFHGLDTGKIHSGRGKIVDSVTFAGNGETFCLEISTGINRTFVDAKYVTFI